MDRSVLQLIGNFHQGGSEQQAVQLTRLLRESGRYRVRVACLDGSGVLREEMEEAGVGEIPEYPMSSFYDRNAVVQLRRFAAFLRQNRIDVVQSHDFYTNVFGMAAARLAGVPARIASRRETTGWRTNKQKQVERLAYRLAHAVVVNADAVGRHLTQEGVPAGKVVTVYNGLDLARVVPAADRRREDRVAEFGLPAGRHRFVTIVANLRHPVKDHATFLRAARRTRAAVADARFVIAGEGELTESMRALAAELGIERDTFFIGRCRNIAELLAISDVCVLSSRAEGFSNSILEYMAAGRPVVVTDVGGAREAVREGETGHLVAAGDEAGMADHLISLLREPERAQAMGERGRRVVEQNFSCAARLARTEQLYDRLLTGCRQRGSGSRRFAVLGRANENRQG